MNIDIQEIMSILPHRYPFLLVDRILEIDLEKRNILGLKNVTANEPQFTGHFPGQPVMPGVLMIEAMAQTAAILVAEVMGGKKNKEVLFLAIDNAKFRKVVRPGDSLMISVEILQNKGAVWKCKAVAKVDDKVAAESALTAMVQDKAETDL